MKLWSFSKIAFLLVFSIALCTGCKDDNNDDENPSVDATIYTESTDAATGRPAYRVASSPNGIGNTTRWTKDRVWILDGFVFVNEGQTLTIEAGTIIKGKEGQGANASALIVSRGGKIIAEGTAQAPIIFTAEQDKLDGSLGVRSGLWGGLVILGKARTNTTTNNNAIEGIPTSEGRGLYGGTDDNDNSGVLRYVSIRHGGSAIAANNEINGLTLGAVGSGTTIEFVEVFANEDDGIEWFGGTVNAKNIVVTACGDDGLDYDEGYRGFNQFVLIYQRTDVGNRGGEHDGGTDPEDGQPYATPTFFNVTSVGSGNLSGENRTITFRDNAGGYYYNSIFTGYAKGIDVELLGSGESSYSRFEAGQLLIANSTISSAAGTTAEELFTISTNGNPTEEAVAAAKAAFAASFVANENTVGSPITRGNLVPSGDTGSTAAPTNSFIQNTSYRGAFAPGQTPWHTGWTATEAFIQ